MQISDNQVIFQPITPFQPDQDYQVVAHAGIAAQSGRILKADLKWQFHVRAPRIVFVRAEGDAPPNLYLLDPAVPDSPKQLSDSQAGVASYDVSPDGNQIVYAEVPQSGAASLFLRDAATSSTRLLYSCEDALCRNPVWRPDGSAVAFELAANTGAIARAPRIWIFDLATNTAHPLWKDNQQLGVMPRWSPDGSQLAATMSDPSGLIIHNLSDNQDRFIPTLEDELANFSSDGRWLTRSERVAPAVGQSATHLVLIDLSAQPYGRRRLTPDSDPASDEEAAWSADSEALLMIRQLPDTGSAPQGSQLDLVQVASGAIEPLLADKGYMLSDIKLSPAGDTLLLQRFPVGQTSDSSGIWLYNLSTRELKQISRDGADPNWMH
jgi:Tol biopolymer transport system component